MEGGLASPEMNGTPNNGTNKKETVYQGANWKKRGKRNKVRISKHFLWCFDLASLYVFLALTKKLIGRNPKT